MKREKKKTEVIMIRASLQEKEQLVELAKQNNMSVSDYMRIVSLNSKISVERNRYDLCNM